jgi:hypothetical protein
MEMEVVHSLTCITIAVEHRPIAALIEAVPPGEITSDTEQGADQGIIARPEVIQRGDVPARHDQDVEWRLRIQVRERDDRTVVVNTFSRNQTRCDLAEQAVDHPVILIEHRCRQGLRPGVIVRTRGAASRSPATIVSPRNHGSDTV